MREIKFRAWDKLTKTMIQNYCYMENGFRFHGYDLTNNTHYIDAVMQYTGLKDKNGKEIYEDDIIRVTDDICLDPGHHVDFRVVFKNGAFVGDEVGKTKDAWYYVDWPSQYFDNCEIIGNIYENPELV